MLTVCINFDYNDYYNFRNYLRNNSWLGAKERVDSMDSDEVQALLDYLDGCDANLEDIQLNDFIWFEWDEVYEEIKKERDNNEED